MPRGHPDVPRSKHPVPCPQGTPAGVTKEARTGSRIRNILAHPDHTTKRVAVVGAGPSGLVAVKELLDEGHEPTCFERATGLGGVFRFDEEDGVVWDSCRLTSSGLLTAFSDYPAPPDQLEQMTVGEYHDYLESYCEEFGVKPRIRFGTTVESVTRDPEGGWHVRVVSGGNGAGAIEERFDAVAVCSGLHQNPHRPAFPGIEGFPGRVLHGAEYRRPDQIAGKRVLIVGAGESGADLVAEVAEHADETVLALRRGVGVLPRKIRGKPNDWLTSRINNSASHWIHQTRNPADERKRTVYKVVFFPLVLADKVVQLTARALGGLRRFGSRKTRRMTRRLLEESGGTLMEQFGTKSDEFVKAIVAGQARRVDQVERFDGGRVYFEDGGEFEPDVVILCTGFDVKAPFLGEDLTAPQRYLHTFVPEAGPSFAFIGFLRPAFGAIPPIAELQARWFALVVSGKAELPPDAEMQASIERLTEFRRRFFRAVHGRLDYLVDFTTLCDELAAQIGCKPTLDAIGAQSRRFRTRFYAAPFVAAQYRLVGPHAKPELATEVIESLPVAHPAHELGAFYMRWQLSRALHRLLGDRYAPKLAIGPG